MRSLRCGGLERPRPSPRDGPRGSHRSSSNSCGPSPSGSFGSSTSITLDSSIAEQTFSFIVQQRLPITRPSGTREITDRCLIGGSAGTIAASGSSCRSPAGQPHPRHHPAHRQNHHFGPRRYAASIPRGQRTAPVAPRRSRRAGGEAARRGLFVAAIVVRIHPQFMRGYTQAISRIGQSISFTSSRAPASAS